MTFFFKKLIKDSQSLEIIFKFGGLSGIFPVSLKKQIYNVYGLIFHSILTVGNMLIIFNNDTLSFNQQATIILLLVQNFFHMYSSSMFTSQDWSEFFQQLNHLKNSQKEDVFLKINILLLLKRFLMGLFIVVLVTFTNFFDVKDIYSFYLGSIFIKLYKLNKGIIGLFFMETSIFLVKTYQNISDKLLSIRIQQKHVPVCTLQNNVETVKQIYVRTILLNQKFNHNLQLHILLLLFFVFLWHISIFINITFWTFNNFYFPVVGIAINIVVSCFRAFKFLKVLL